MENIYNRIAVIFDDHRLFTESFSTLIERLNLFSSIYTFDNQEELHQFFMQKKDSRPVYAFVDYYLPGGNAIPLIKDISKLSKGLKIIMVTSLMNPILINDLLLYRPSGFLSKTTGTEEVLACLRSIDAGIQYVSPYIKEILASTQVAENVFTLRELELLRLFYNGYNIEDSAKLLYLSPHTIVAHRRKMMRKTNTKSIVELLAHARNAGLI